MEVTELHDCWELLALPGLRVLQKLTALHLQTVAEHGRFVTQPPTSPLKGKEAATSGVTDCMASVGDGSIVNAVSGGSLDWTYSGREA